MARRRPLLREWSRNAQESEPRREPELRDLGPSPWASTSSSKEQRPGSPTNRRSSARLIGTRPGLADRSQGRRVHRPLQRSERRAAALVPVRGHSDDRLRRGRGRIAWRDSLAIRRIGVKAVFGRVRTWRWSRHSDLNRGPAVYETAALPLSYVGVEPVLSRRCSQTPDYSHARRSRPAADPVFERSRRHLLPGQVEYARRVAIQWRAQTRGRRRTRARWGPPKALAYRPSGRRT